MAINQVSKQQPMRAGEIAAIDALNEAINQINALDVSGINTRLTNIETSITNLNARVDAIDNSTTGSVALLASRVTTNETDIAAIKRTLYTNLDQNI